MAYQNDEFIASSVLHDTTGSLYSFVFASAVSRNRWFGSLGVDKRKRGFASSAASLRASVAQPVEQLICNQQVVGSSPSASSLSWVARMAPFAWSNLARRDIQVLEGREVPNAVNGTDRARSSPVGKVGRSPGLNPMTGGFPSGQRGQTVNLMALPSQVRILHPPMQ
jgi:hypothetical protein